MFEPTTINCQLICNKHGQMILVFRDEEEAEKAQTLLGPTIINGFASYGAYYNGLVLNTEPHP